MHQEVIALKVTLGKTNETLIEMFLAPPYVVRAFAEFLANREEDEMIDIKQTPVAFQDFDVNVGDSKKVAAAFECLKHYNMPLGNYSLCSDIINASSNLPWKSDANFRIFERWFSTRKEEDDEE